jgi:hypothetical protein
VTAVRKSTGADQDKIETAAGPLEFRRRFVRDRLKAGLCAALAFRNLPAKWLHHFEAFFSFFFCCFSFVLSFGLLVFLSRSIPLAMRHLHRKI